MSNASTDEMNKIVICKHCGKPEYYGEMRWLSRSCECRSCYKARWEELNCKVYKWDDLDGPRPTVEEYYEQEESANRCKNCGNAEGYSGVDEHYCNGFNCSIRAEHYNCSIFIHKKNKKKGHDFI